MYIGILWFSARVSYIRSTFSVPLVKYALCVRSVYRGSVAHPHLRSRGVLRIRGCLFDLALPSTLSGAHSSLLLDPRQSRVVHSQLFHCHPTPDSLSRRPPTVSICSFHPRPSCIASKDECPQAPKVRSPRLHCANKFTNGCALCFSRRFPQLDQGEIFALQDAFHKLDVDDRGYLDEASVIKATQQSERQPYDVVRQTLKGVELDSSRRVELEDYIDVGATFRPHPTPSHRS